MSDSQRLIRMKADLESLLSWKAQMEHPQYGIFQRVRELEDFKLAAEVKHRAMIAWTSIAASCFSGAVSIASHLWWK